MTGKIDKQLHRNLSLSLRIQSLYLMRILSNTTRLSTSSSSSSPLLTYETLVTETRLDEREKVNIVTHRVLLLLLLLPLFRGCLSLASLVVFTPQGEMMKSRLTNDATKRYTSACPLVGNFEDTIELQQGNIESLCAVISSDIASHVSCDTMKRSNDSHLVPFISGHTQESEMRRRKSYKSIHKEQFNAPFHENTMTTSNRLAASRSNKYRDRSSIPSDHRRLDRDKNKCKRKPLKSQGNPSIDSIPFRLNSVSKIDKASRILFPIAFAIINYFYWHTFMLQDDDTDARVQR